MNVTADRPEVPLILDQSRLEAALGEMARPPMPLGVPVGVSGDQVLHAPSSRLRSTKEQVDMVGHECETQHVPTETADGLLQSLEQALVIVLVLEDCSPQVSMGHHVMDRARVFDPQRSGHDPMRSHGAPPENRKPGLTPRSPSDPAKPFGP